LKHLGVFLLLTVFLYNLVGVYPVAMWQQHELRRTAEKLRRSSLPDAALVRITVARHPVGAAPLQWHEPHEFSYRGQRYDIVRQRATPDSVAYFCWHDRGEEKLLAGLAKHLREYAHPEAGARKSAKKAFSDLSKLSFLLPTTRLSGSPTARVVKPKYAFYAAALSSLPAEVPFAPPRRPANFQA
jgi:hypothetical protein